MAAHIAVICVPRAWPDGCWRRVCGHRDFAGEPTTLPGGNRSLLLRDPDGNLVDFFTPLPRPPSESSLADHIPAARQVPADRSPRIPEIPVPWGDPGGLATIGG
jgi:hypothetical protein